MRYKLDFEGSVTIFVLILLGMTIGLYLFGFVSPFWDSANSLLSSGSSPSDSVGTFLNLISDSIVSAFTEHLEIILPMTAFGLLAGFTGGSYAGGSILRFLIPVMLLFVVVNIFFFPVIPTIASEAVHTEGFNYLITILSVILNAFMFLAIFSFVSGED